jgi:chorismate--pyruvate lyase
VNEARWTAQTLRRLPGVPRRLQSWLGDHGSLTRAVIGACDGRFAVNLVRQGHGVALPSEAALLDGGSPQAMLVREVRLACDHAIWVYARTVIPLHGLRGAARGLATLGRRPLGEVLFSDPLTRRHRIEVARILPRHRLFAAATDHLEVVPTALWGRRTLFDYGGCPILVNELFLPIIPAMRP